MPESEKRPERKSRVTVRIDRCTVTPLEKGTYRAVIEGDNLHGAIVPPRVTVGGVELEEIRYKADGKGLEGLLRAQPRSATVVVDYGFARAEHQM